MNPLEKLIKQKQEILEEKYKYERKIIELSNMVTSLNHSIYNECGKLGHEYVTEIEKLDEFGQLWLSSIRIRTFFLIQKMKF